MNFGQATEEMRAGRKVSRNGWNGRGMWLRIIDLYTDREFTVIEHNPCVGTWLQFIAMKTADNKIVPWLASQADMLSDDWSVVA